MEEIWPLSYLVPYCAFSDKQIVYDSIWIDIEYCVFPMRIQTLPYMGTYYQGTIFIEGISYLYSIT